MLAFFDLFLNTSDATNVTGTIHNARANFTVVAT